MPICDGGSVFCAGKAVSSVYCLHSYILAKRQVASKTLGIVPRWCYCSGPCIKLQAEPCWTITSTGLLKVEPLELELAPQSEKHDLMPLPCLDSETRRLEKGPEF